MNTGYFWIFAAIVFGVVEIIVPGLVSIWFAIGAAVAYLVSLVTDSIVLQSITFLIVSLATLLLLRKNAKLLSKNPKSDFGRVIGKEVVIKHVDKNGNYSIYLDGKEWSGKSSDTLSVGEIAVVEKIDGVKLVLKKK